MPKNSKVRAEARRSEVKKYQDTMMADMGLKSLDDLPPEERRRWIKALMPSEGVKKKLKVKFVNSFLDVDNLAPLST